MRFRSVSAGVAALMMLTVLSAGCAKDEGASKAEQAAARAEDAARRAESAASRVEAAAQRAEAAAEKAERLLGYKTTVHLEEGVRKMVAWARELGPQEPKYLDDGLELITDQAPTTWTQISYVGPAIPALTAAMFIEMTLGAGPSGLQPGKCGFDANGVALPCDWGQPKILIDDLSIEVLN